MRAMVLDGGFGLENLKLVERPSPQPGPGQVVLRMRAASINYRDLMMIRGHYNPKQPLPLIPCSDGVGHVIRVGAGVTRVQDGDRVATLFAQNWVAGGVPADVATSTLGGPLDGTLQEEMLISEQGVVKLPSFLSDEQAATLTCAGVTAWSALVTYGKLKAGQSVLLLGTGGVSIFGLQLAKLLGAEAIITSSDDKKLDRARRLGADHCINYKEQPEWAKRVLEITGGRGVDHVVEVGGAGTLQQSIDSTAAGGTISVIGVLSGVHSDLNFVKLLMNSIRAQGVFVGSRESFEALVRAIAQNKLGPIVDRVVDFEKATEAFATMADCKHFGKIAIRIGG